MTNNMNTTIVGGNVTTTIVLEQKNSDGTYSSVGDNMPAGIPVTFTISNGTVNTTSTTLVSGEAGTIFTVTHAGTSTVSATLDNQTLTQQIIVDPSVSNITTGNVTVMNGKSVNLTATLTDANGNPLSGQSLNFSVNGVVVGNAMTNSNGVATLNYTPTSKGNYTVTVSYNGNADYLSSTGNGNLTVNPSAYLYLNVTSSKDNLNVGETSIITYKLSNSGSDGADNVKVSLQIPNGLEFVTASVDSGNWTYNSTTNTLTWTLANVPVGDPYLYLTVKPLSTGNYTILSFINSETANANTNTSPSITINAKTPNNPNVPTGNNTTNTTTTTTPTNPTDIKTVSAVTNTIPMEHTGVPLAGLALAILAIFGGMLPRRKQ